ncbi:fibronectin type III domain-containing protein 7-like [Brachyistius frenatus]|uniref:fibronectin type III domain-containing protein 7-like n=1 Tax=Brachyistius frenatus TaxID=100188 RepID=UPI0037E777E6
MKCGLTYNVTVVARDEACNSSRSPVEQLSTAPCPPPSFLPALDCGTGVVSVTWNHSVEAVVYAVSAVDAFGRRYDCNGTYSSCSFSTLECGTEYNVTITPSRNGCVGRNSPTKMIMTVPCVPHLSEVEMDCLTNSAWVMYNQSAGAEDYVVMATDSQGNVRTFECNSTSDGTCALPPLTCSQNLTFTLKAQDEQCTSAASNGIAAETAPCPPENVMESVDCDSGTITVTWSAVAGAVSYTATLDEISGGATACCTTSDTSCDVADLPCGEMYVLYVTAQGRTCNSSESQEQLTRTVPCVPENLEAGLSCRTNVASMTWNYSKGGQFYKVKAVSTDGHEDGCSSPNNRCDLTSLRCGQYYTATVTAEDVVCRSEPGDSVTIKTVPCTPENVSSVMACDANALVVSWSESSGADSYIATMQDSDGQRTSCQAMTEGSCNMTGLGCGQILHVAVVSSDGFCDSPPSPSVDTPSGRTEREVTDGCLKERQTEMQLELGKTER